MSYNMNVNRGIMAKIIEEIKADVIELIIRCPSITENEIGKQLKLSKRFGKRLFDDMLAKGEICLS